MFSVYTNNENIFVTKISRSTVGGIYVTNKLPGFIAKVGSVGTLNLFKYTFQLPMNTA